MTDWEEKLTAWGVLLGAVIGIALGIILTVVDGEVSGIAVVPVGLLRSLIFIPVTWFGMWLIYAAFRKIIAPIEFGVQAVTVARRTEILQTANADALTLLQSLELPYQLAEGWWSAPLWKSGAEALPGGGLCKVIWKPRPKALSIHIACAALGFQAEKVRRSTLKEEEIDLDLGDDRFDLATLIRHPDPLLGSWLNREMRTLVLGLLTQVTVIRDRQVLVRIDMTDEDKGRVKLHDAICLLNGLAVLGGRLEAMSFHARMGHALLVAGSEREQRNLLQSLWRSAQEHGLADKKTIDEVTFSWAMWGKGPTRLLAFEGVADDVRAEVLARIASDAEERDSVRCQALLSWIIAGDEAAIKMLVRFIEADEVALIADLVRKTGKRSPAARRAWGAWGDIPQDERLVQALGRIEVPSRVAPVVAALVGCCMGERAERDLGEARIRAWFDQVKTTPTQDALRLIAWIGRHWYPVAVMNAALEEGSRALEQEIDDELGRVSLSEGPGEGDLALVDSGGLILTDDVKDKTDSSHQGP